MTQNISTTEIRKLVKAGNFIVGTERAIKNLKLGKVDKVIVSSNCPEKVIADLERYASLSKAETFRAAYPNEELGVICKKPYSISVLSIPKGAK